MRKRSAKERKKILLQCEYRLAVIFFLNIGDKNAGMNTKSASDAGNISPHVDNFLKILTSTAKKIRRFAKTTKIFSLWWRWEFILFFISVFMQIIHWLLYIFYAILLGYYLGRVSREWKDYNIVFRLLTIIIIVCCIRNIFHFTHFIAQNFSLWTFWNF